MLYQNEIRKMSGTELLELIENQGLVLDDPEYVDADEIIQLLEDKEGRVFESAEDDILDSIMNGNWTDAAKQMLAMHITPNGLIDYIEDYRYEVFDEAYEWFTLESAVAITELYYRTREVA